MIEPVLSSHQGPVVLDESEHDLDETTPLHVVVKCNIAICNSYARKIANF
jgi:hypothetical protein